jgi:CHAD domain-containing protein
MGAEMALVAKAVDEKPQTPGGSAPPQATSHSPELSVVDAFELIATYAVEHIRSNDAAFVATAEPENLHQMRVGLRQLLSVFWIFKPVLADEASFRAIGHELRGLNDELGVIRNLDVCLAGAREGSKEHCWLTRQRARRYEIARDELYSSERQRIYSRTLKWIVSRDWQRDSLEAPGFRPLVTVRLDRLWQKILRFGDSASKLGRHRRHRLRIRIKTLRYSMDFLQLPICPAKPAREKFTTQVQALQKTLGKLNDLETRRDFRADAGLKRRTYGGEKGKQIRRATHHLRKLHRIGPCWRGPPDN